MLGKLFGFALACVFVGALAPMAITAITTANQTGWDASSIAIWTVAGVAVAGGMVILILKEAGIEF